MGASGPSSNHPAARSAREREANSRESERSQAQAGHDERRRFDRHSLTAEVGLRSESNFYTGFTEDVSEGGLFLATVDLAPIGTEIEITFTLPDGHIVSTRGIVRWTRQARDWSDHETTAGMGIQFRELLPEDREAIQMFIATRQPLFYAD
jgi:uncharacterized protein (TIGR02266 family)